MWFRPAIFLLLASIVSWSSGLSGRLHEATHESADHSTADRSTAARPAAAVAEAGGKSHRSCRHRHARPVPASPADQDRHETPAQDDHAGCSVCVMLASAVFSVSPPPALVVGATLAVCSDAPPADAPRPALSVDCISARGPPRL